jgi:hypothetical protein
VGNGLGPTTKFVRLATSCAAGNGLGTTIKYLRQTMSGATGNCLGTTIKYLRRTTSGAAGNGLGTTAKYLRRATSGAAGNGMSRYRGLLICPFTTSAPQSPFCVLASADFKNNITNEVRGLGDQSVCEGPKLARCAHYGVYGHKNANISLHKKKQPRITSKVMNTASKLGPHSHTNRWACKVWGYKITKKSTLHYRGVQKSSRPACVQWALVQLFEPPAF